MSSQDRSAAQGQLGPGFHQRDEDNIDATRDPAATTTVRGIRETGKQGDILHLTIPVEAHGIFRRLTATVKVDIFVERIQDGEVVLVAAEPRLETKRG